MISELFNLGLVDAVVWFVLLQLLSFSIFPYAAKLFPSALDRGYGLSKTLAFFIFGFGCWILPVLGVVPAHRNYVTLVFALMLFAGWRAYHDPAHREELVGVIKRHALCVETLFLGVSFLFLFIRFLNPEIVWGEKPMDSTFLHFFVRNETLPPQDPWASGSQMSYYYVGIYFVAALLKLLGIPVSIGYNLAIATLGGLIASTLYTTFLLFTRSIGFSILAAATLCFATDPEVLNLCILQLKNPNFDTFWASTRVFTSPWFFEYTSWSLLFADLHAHVIAIPITLLSLTCFSYLFLNPSERYLRTGAYLRFLLGVSVGALYGMNTWDFITFGFCIGVGVLCAPVNAFWKPPVKSDGAVEWYESFFSWGFARIVAVVWDGGLIAFGVCFSVLPYSLTSTATQSIWWGWAGVEEFNTLGQLLRMLGYWIVALLFAFVFLLRKNCIHVLIVVCSLTILFNVSLPIIHFIKLYFTDHLTFQGALAFQPWGIVAFCSVLFALALGVGNSHLSNEKADESANRSIALTVGLIGIALCLIVALEELFLIDRMNTLFKGYMAVWILLGIGGITLLYWVIKSRITKRSPFKSFFLISLFPLILASLSFLGFLLNAAGVISMVRVPVREHTLDGARYLTFSNPDDAAAISWLNAAVRGTPVTLEAHGDAYQHYTRIAMHTGLPTVFGWEHHVKQRGLKYEEVEQRGRDVREIYTATDPKRVRKLLVKYKIDLVVVGKVEKDLYGDAGLEKFGFSEIFTPLFSAGETTVYATYFSKLY